MQYVAVATEGPVGEGEGRNKGEAEVGHGQLVCG